MEKKVIMQNVAEFKIPTMLTIKETAEKTGLAEHFIRGLAIGNQIVHVRCGKKYLINLEKLIEYLNSSKGEDCKEPSDTKFSIRPIKG